MGYRVSKRAKKAKKNVVIANFSKIEARLKALYVGFWGISEGVKKWRSLHIITLLLQ